MQIPNLHTAEHTKACAQGDLLDSEKICRSMIYPSNVFKDLFQHNLLSKSKARLFQIGQQTRFFHMPTLLFPSALPLRKPLNLAEVQCE